MTMMPTATTPSTLLTLAASALKPTSRARIYRVPNSSDNSSALTKNNNSDNENTNVQKSSVSVTSGGNIAAPESFLWATREMAALDFLMNVPLNAEKDIVRAGLSECRWQNARQQPPPPQLMTCHSAQIKHHDHEQHEVVNEENKYWSTSQSHTRSLSAFDITRCDDEGGSRMSETTTTITESSSLHAISLDNNKHSTTSSSTMTAGGGRWWDKLILKDKRFFSVANQLVQRREQMELEERELERPTESPSLLMMSSNDGNVTNAQYSMGMIGASTTATTAGGVPGRRLDGIEAVTITIPQEFRRRPAPVRAAARQAAVREWEIRVAYGTPQQGAKQRVSHHQGLIDKNHTTSSRQALLDGRVFFSTKKSYPVAVFSTIKYEPKKEETLRRRKQLEELGGGGTQFVLPERDWSELSHVV